MWMDVMTVCTDSSSLAESLQQIYVSFRVISPNIGKANGTPRRIPGVVAPNT